MSQCLWYETQSKSGLTSGMLINELLFGTNCVFSQYFLDIEVVLLKRGDLIPSSLPLQELKTDREQEF